MEDLLAGNLKECCNDALLYSLPINSIMSIMKKSDIDDVDTICIMK